MGEIVDRRSPDGRVDKRIGGVRFAPIVLEFAPTGGRLLAVSHVRRAAELGLLEEGTDPETGDRRYFVSNVLRPLIRPLISDDEHREACAAARALYGIWVTASPVAEGGGAES